MQAKRKLAPDFNLVRIDETSDWENEWREKNGIKAIYTVWLYDSKVVTHLAEMAPNYWMRRLYTYPIFNSGGDEYADHVDYEIQNTEVKYNDYFHCSDIDQIKNKEDHRHLGSPFQVPRNWKPSGPPYSATDWHPNEKPDGRKLWFEYLRDEVTYQELEDAAAEYFEGNQVL